MLDFGEFAPQGNVLVSLQCHGGSQRCCGMAENNPRAIVLLTKKDPCTLSAQLFRFFSAS